MIQLLQQVPDHCAGFVDRDVRQIAAGVQAFQEHGPANRVGRQQAHSTSAGPVLQGQMLVSGGDVGPGHLQDGGGAIASSDRQYQSRHAMQRVPVGRQIPLRQ